MARIATSKQPPRRVRQSGSAFRKLIRSVAAAGLWSGVSEVCAQPRSPRFQESCHPSDLNTRGLEDMTHASLQ
jgi:hypothetical protein